MSTTSAGSLRTADIIVSTTDHPISRGIRAGTGASVSHAMLYIGNQEVVEAIGEGVVRRALSLALMDATLAILLRRRNLSSGKAAEVVQHAIGFQGRPYDGVGAAGSGTTHGRGALLAAIGCQLWLPACGGAAGAVYRNASESERDKTFFCSELVARCYELAGVPIVDGSPSLTSPRTVRVSRYLYYMGRIR